MGKQGHGRRSSHFRTQTSTKEFALAKPVKCSSKFAVKSSGLSVAEKASGMGIKIAGKKMSSTSTGGRGMTQALTRALNLFDSDSSASDDESAPSPPRAAP
jgi:hypothetical protein